MDGFSVKPGVLAGESDTFKGIINVLSRIEGEVSSVKNNLNWQVKQRENIDRSLDNIKVNIQSLRKKTSSYGNGVVQCAKWYGNTENNILKNAGGKSVYKTDDYGKHKFDMGKQWYELFRGVISIAPFGGGIAFVTDLIKCDWSGKNVNNLLKDALGVVKTVVGINEKGSMSKYAQSLIKSEKGDFLGKLAKNLGFDKVSLGNAVKWGGYVLTGIGNIFTYSDRVKYGSYNTAQKWSSVILKTGLDIGIAAGLTAVVAAAGAPAIVASAAAVGVVWVADTITKCITNGECGATEAVTNCIVKWGSDLANFFKKGYSYG